MFYVGGTGEISMTSVWEAVKAGHNVTVFNRGKSSLGELPAGVTSILGDIHDSKSYARLGTLKFDVVCAFMVFRPEQIKFDIDTFKRMLVGKSVLVTGDGTSPWTLTRSADFSVPLIRLFGNNRAFGQDFHITNDRAFTWDQIHAAIGRTFDVEVTETLIRYNAEWTGPLTGDKTWTATAKRAETDLSTMALTKSILGRAIGETKGVFDRVGFWAGVPAVAPASAGRRLEARGVEPL